MLQTISSYIPWGFVQKSWSYTCLPPALLWSAGAVEGAVRCVFHGMVSAGSKTFGYHELASREFNQCKADGWISVGCILLGGVSLIPIGNLFGTFQIYDECKKYYAVRAALGKAYNAQERIKVFAILDEMDTKELTPEYIAELSKRMEERPSLSNVGLLQEDHQLKASMIDHYVLYSVPYKTGEYGIRTVRFVVSKTYALSSYLFKFGLVKQLAKESIRAVVIDISECQEAMNGDTKLHPVMIKGALK